VANKPDMMQVIAETTGRNDIVTEKISVRKGKMVNLTNDGKGHVRIAFSIPSRALIDPKGTGLLNSYLAGYEEFCGDFPARLTGSLVSDRQGLAVADAIHRTRYPDLRGHACR
jgi:GTP-binding protein